MSKVQETYENRFAGHGYDLLVRAVFAPVGGIERLREEALDAIGIHAGMRVLELGCGTGSMTEKMLARGAQVTAVDGAEVMLARAKVRAPNATYECAELTTYVPRERYDLVLFSFVLHELIAEDRARVLRAMRGQTLAIVEHAVSGDGVIPRAVSAVVHGFEPPSMNAWIRGGVERELVEAGFVVSQSRQLARGTAMVLAARSID